MRDEVHALPEIKNRSAAAEALMKPKSNKVRERERKGRERDGYFSNVYHIL